MNDVYGITEDLKVYYCSNGSSTILGLTKDDLGTEDPNKVIFSNTQEEATESQKKMYSFLQKYDLDDDGNLSTKETKNVTSLEITPSDNVTSFSEFYYLTNLSSITLKNLKLENIDGMSSLPLLKNLTFENTTVGNYDGIAENKNLEFLCFIVNDNTNVDGNLEIKKLCGSNGDNHLGISKSEFGKLNKLAITGTMARDGLPGDFDRTKSNISDLSHLSNLNQVTKKTIKELYIQNNLLTNIDFLDGFSGLNFINLDNNNLETLSPLKNCVLLKTLYAGMNPNLGVNDSDDVSDENNSLYSLKYCVNLTSIVMINNAKYKFISYINDLNNLRYFRCDSSNLNEEDLLETKDFLKKLPEGYMVNHKYSLLLMDSDETFLNICEEKIDKTIFSSIANYKSLKTLWMQDMRLVDESGAELPLEESNNIINSVLSQLPNLEALDVCGVKINTIDFIFNSKSGIVNTPKLDVLYLLRTNITNLSNLEKVTIRTLGIDNENIDLTSIQNTISNCKDVRLDALHGFEGLYLGSSGLMSQLSSCTNVTNLEMNYANWGKDFSDLFLNLNLLTQLENVKIIGVNLGNLILPSSVKELTISSCGCFPDLSNLSLLKYLSYQKGDSNDKYSISNVINSLQSKVLNSEVTTEIHLSGLKELTSLSGICEKFNISTMEIIDCVSLVNLEGIFVEGVSVIDNFTELILKNNSSLSSLNGLKKLTTLSKLTMNGCGVTDLTELRNMGSLDYLDLRDSKFDGNGNLQILSDLRANKSSLKLYLSGCPNILDWSLLSKYGSWWHDNEKAGY